MANKEIKKTAKLVESILRLYPATRNSDDVLYIIVCNEILHANGITNGVKGFYFSQVLLERKRLGLPTYGTVSRARRKIAAEFPELRGGDAVEGYREELEHDFVEYARE